MLTPAMQQYFDIKSKNPDSIIFFRMWDFYEMFWDDAYIAHKVLWINITSRNKNSKESIPLAWIPYHARDKYLPMLVNAWYKVAIVEQVSDPKLKWIVKREVVRVVTPATLSLEWDQFDDVSIWSTIISIVKKEDKYWLSVLDIITNNWKTWEFQNIKELSSQIYLISPSEVILSKDLFWDEEIKNLLEKKYSLNIYYFTLVWNAREILLNHFGVFDLKWYWIDDKDIAIESSALLLEYINSNQKKSLKNYNTIWLINNLDYLELDESTIKNLDLIYNYSTNSHTLWTLFWVLNNTNSPMWKRVLRQNILKPLKDIDKIKERQDFIESIIKDRVLFSEINSRLKMICDMDAVLNRLALDRVSPRDLLNLKKSLIAIIDIIEIINKSKNTKLINIISKYI